MIDIISQFREAIMSTGLEPPNVIETGKLHRFPGVGKRNGNTAGWCIFFDDGQGGCFGDWSSGFSENWQVTRDKPFSPKEREAFKHHVKEATAQAEAELKTKHDAAASKATSTWNAASTAPDDHPYLIKKSIRPCGTRQHKDALLIPMRKGKEILSLQFIAPDGGKRFLTDGRVTGCYYSIGTTLDADAMCITEGFATGATIHQATGYPVAVAFNAGNLAPVTEAIHESHPALPLIVCADDDAATAGNPGLTKATAAAESVGGLLAIPDFGSDRPDGSTDFNDMAALSGLESVKLAIEKASGPSTYPWPEALPLTTKLESEPYPLDALPDTIRRAVCEVQGFTKAPVPMVASSALAALSLTVQGHIDIRRAEKLTGPVGLFLLTIADSGERKSTCDGYFTTAIREYQDQQAEAAKPELSTYHADLSAWEAQRNGIRDKIRQLARQGKPSQKQIEALREIEADKPVARRVPYLLRGDETPENLAWVLSREWPSGGVVSAEAGIVFGAHGMGKDSIMRNLALLNILWDGGTLSVGRRTSDSFVVQGARLTVALQVQEATLRSFFDRSGGLARGTGFLARFLIAWPESTQGFRPFSEAPRSWPALAAFNQRITAILEQSSPIDDEGVLSPILLPLTPEAKAAWVTFHDAIEHELRSGGELYDVRDVASKTADNAVRLAALFQALEHSTNSAVDLDAFEGASRIAAWHLNEARRFFGELVLPAEQIDAARLDAWLTGYCHREGTHALPRRELQRNVTPVHLRRKAALDNALEELIEARRIRLVAKGRRKEIHVNPALLKGGFL